ncbi:hypothetical protein V2J09_016227 [Rumex salicifolius]
MGKVSPKDRESKTPKQRRRSRKSSNKYLKPGALAQLRYTKANGAKAWADLGKNCAGFLADKKSDHAKNDYLSVISKDIEDNPLMMSPERFIMSPQAGSFDLLKQSSVLQTPKTPMMVAETCESDSRLEALPMDILVMVARQMYFNYTTPDRSRQEMLRTMTPLAADRWPFASKGDGKGFNMSNPHTPKAPKHGPRPPSRLKCTEMKQIAAVLFQEPSFPSRCLVPSVLSKPLCKNRVLFYEDELCQAVAQNKLRFQ